MKKITSFEDIIKLFGYLMIFAALFMLFACSNANVTSWGGTKEIVLPEGMKFVNYKIESNGGIWCTYRPMREDEQPETYIFQQDKGGIHIAGDGKFIIYEIKDGVQSLKPEELNNESSKQ